MVRWASGSPGAGATVRISATCVVAVWVLVSVGGATNPGFKQYEQYLSTLSADGIQAPQWGRAAMVVAALGIACVVPVLWTWRRGVGGAAGVAALAAVAIVAAPLNCPAGERFCAGETAQSGAAELHAGAVLLFCAAVLTLALAAGRQILAGARRQPPLWPTVLVAASATVLIAPALLQVSGLLQRTLLLAAQVVVVCAAAFAHGELRRRRREHLRRLIELESPPAHPAIWDLPPGVPANTGRMLP